MSIKEQLKIVKITDPNDTTLGELVGESVINQIMHLIAQHSQVIANEAYEQGKNAGHAAQHAKDLEEMWEEAYREGKLAILNTLDHDKDFFDRPYKEAKAKLLALLQKETPDFMKPGALIPYTTIRGKNYVELDWLTHQLTTRKDGV